MRISTVLAAVLMAAVLLGVTESRAQMGQGPMGQGMMRGRMMERGGGRCFGDMDFMHKTLKLSDSQISEVARINDRCREMLMVYRNKLMPKKEELRKALLKDNPDFSALRSLLQEISGIELEIRLIRIKQSLDIEKVFDPSQREQLRRERMNWD